ncbi:MAG: aminoacyl-tRNA hydrolase [Bacteroidales bacterium]|nr:aminoacyl-tRNA hydrolase [Bacteroidales bacterium]
MKFLIVGLGNIGEKYKNTRHNIGFQVLDALAGASNLVFEHQRHAFRTLYKYKGKQIVLIKPTTLMNLSGKAVRYWLNEEKVLPENCLVIVDDIALPFGTIRIKKQGSDGGHNGLLDIAIKLGHNKFPRLRFGVDDNFSRGRQADYVLQDWGKDEAPALPERIDKMIEAIQSFSTIGLERTMNYFNGK